MAVFLSKLTSKAQTVIPRALRAKLQLKPGDTVRYTIRDDGAVVIDKMPMTAGHQALAAFAEWGSPADDDAFGVL